MSFFQKIKDKFINKESAYEQGLAKSRGQLNKQLNILASKFRQIDDEYFEELEEIFYMADIGVQTTSDFIEKMKKRVKIENISDPNNLNPIIIDELFLIYVEGQVISTKINYQQPLTVILVVGVNGVGKTTSIGKLAYKMQQENKKVLLAAGDTFRAGAIKQLQLWGERLNIDVYAGTYEQDPSSVIYGALEKAKDNYDVLICDTAGRLQNKDNLMKELEKINRIINKQIPGAPHETLLVIDATTGQNGISQAKTFKEVTPISGIILTKLDGSAKGGIVLAIKEVIDIPVKLVGLGEQKEDLVEFNIEEYIYSLFEKR